MTDQETGRLWLVGRPTIFGPAGEEVYDGVAPYALEDWAAWERDGMELSRPERPGHREIAAWDARVDAWRDLETCRAFPG